MSCVLRIEGSNFNVKSFLDETRIESYMIFEKGNEIDSGQKKYYSTSGCSFEVSQAEFEFLSLQVDDAILYLNKHFKEFKMLSKFGLKKTEPPVLDFPIITRMNDVAMQTDYFKPELLKLAGNLNFAIELTQYHGSEQ